MRNQLEIVFWNVQHGHSTYIKTPNNRHIVVDLGTGTLSGDKIFSPLRHLRDISSVSCLDLVIITHPHGDHIDDISNFNLLSPKVLVRPKHIKSETLLKSTNNAKEKELLAKYSEINDRYNRTIAKESPYYIYNPDNWGGLKINCFSPKNSAESNINNHSIVTLFEFEKIKVLIPGDNESPSWNELKEDSDFIERTKDIDILLAPHHGRDSGFDSEIVKSFNPRLTVISDGPQQSTSNTNGYSNLSRGLDIYKSDGTMENRKCLTTRTDGIIKINIGIDLNGRKCLYVKKSM